MKSMKTILILAIFPIVILACGDSNDTTVINHVVTPEPKPVKPNLSPPTIRHIVVPDQVHAGAKIKLEALAEDPDGNTLTYNWEAPGKFLNKAMSIAIWTAPIDLGLATINLTVNDGIHENKQSVDVHVIPALIVPGQEAAGIRLGARLNEVIDIYGEPTHQADIAELDLFPHEFTEWDTKVDWNNHGLTVYLRNNSRVFAIVIGAPNSAITVAGNGIGSDCDQIRDEMDKNFGRNLRGGGGSSRGYYAYIWDHHGIEIRCHLEDWENWHRSAEPENPIVYQIVISKSRPEWNDPFGWPDL